MLSSSDAVFDSCVREAFAAVDDIADFDLLLLLLLLINIEFKSLNASEERGAATCNLKRRTSRRDVGCGVVGAAVLGVPVGTFVVVELPVGVPVDVIGDVVGAVVARSIVGTWVGTSVGSSVGSSDGSEVGDDVGSNVAILGTEVVFSGRLSVGLHVVVISSKSKNGPFLSIFDDTSG